MGRTRVIKVEGGYRIQEIVTSDGHYIEWPTLHSTPESAFNEIKQVKFDDLLDQNEDMQEVSDGAMGHEDRV